jgi:hypothetical protein
LFSNREGLLTSRNDDDILLDGLGQVPDEAPAGPTPEETAARAASAPQRPPRSNLSDSLQVVQKSKGPVMTTLEEFYKVGPGPSSSHTIGPMRIAYDFYQRCTKLPADQLARATALMVHLFGSLSATGKRHGTERAALAGIIGKEPATSMDNILKPILITRGAHLPMLLVFAGVIGGMYTFGLMGIFIGPVVLAVGWTLLQNWAIGTPGDAA